MTVAVTASETLDHFYKTLRATSQKTVIFISLKQLKWHAGNSTYQLNNKKLLAEHSASYSLFVSFQVR
jgi:hypothetical protein